MIAPSFEIVKVLLIFQGFLFTIQNRYIVSQVFNIMVSFCTLTQQMEFFTLLYCSKPKLCNTMVFIPLQKSDCLMLFGIEKQKPIRGKCDKNIFICLYLLQGSNNNHKITLYVQDNKFGGVGKNLVVLLVFAIHFSLYVSPLL